MVCVGGVGAVSSLAQQPPACLAAHQQQAQPSGSVSLLAEALSSGPGAAKSKAAKKNEKRKAKKADGAGAAQPQARWVSQL